MMTYTQEKLKEILYLHKKWLNNEDGGVRANLRGANLLGVDLRGVDLSSADLHSADLRYAVGEMEYIKSLQCEKYYISYTSHRLNIGCRSHTILEWWSFDDDTISKMDDGALEWWKKWKPILMQIIEISPALESEAKE